jgi:hypothetical protein
MARQKPKSSLDFARLLRAVIRSSASGWDLSEFLNTGDPRTACRILQRAGIVHAQRLTLEQILQKQRLIGDVLALLEIRRALQMLSSPERFAE